MRYFLAVDSSAECVPPYSVHKQPFFLACFLCVAMSNIAGATGPVRDVLLHGATGLVRAKAPNTIHKGEKSNHCMIR